MLCHGNVNCVPAVEGEDVMDALLSITHRRTVPQVFIQGEFIGGCDGEQLLPKHWQSSKPYVMH